MAMPKILVINGPNLDMLGVREPEVYGDETLDALEAKVADYASRHGIEADFMQSNSEGEIIDAIQGAREVYAGIVYNPGAHAHYSYALRDAVASITVPVVEVHISNIAEREEFRRTSVIAPACVARVMGLGFDGYCRAIDVFREHELLARLGEGYEERYPSGQSIIVGIPDDVDEPEEEMAPAVEQEAAPASADQLDLEPDADALAVVEPEDTLDSSIEEQEDFDEQSAGLVSFERQNVLQEACAQMGLDAFMVRDTSNIAWLTAFDGVFDEERAHALLVKSDGTMLHTDSRYTNALRTVANAISSDIVVSGTRKSHARFAADALASGAIPFNGLIGIEDTITYDEFIKMAEEFGTDCLVPTKDVVVGHYRKEHAARREVVQRGAEAVDVCSAVEFHVGVYLLRAYVGGSAYDFFRTGSVLEDGCRLAQAEI